MIISLKMILREQFKDAYDQTLLCAEALTSNDYKFVTQSGREIKKTVRPRLIFPVCVVSDHYPALAFQARHFLKTNTTSVVQAPLITDVFAVDAITEMLNTPLNLLNYLALRARFGEKIFATNELTILGLHLRQNLWLDPQLDGLALDESLASNLDIAMFTARRRARREDT